MGMHVYETRRDDLIPGIENYLGGRILKSSYSDDLPILDRDGTSKPGISCAINDPGVYDDEIVAIL
jgi:hypothetical protein